MGSPRSPAAARVLNFQRVRLHGKPSPCMSASARFASVLPPDTRALGRRSSLGSSGLSTSSCSHLQWRCRSTALVLPPRLSPPLLPHNASCQIMACNQDITTIDESPAHWHQASAHWSHRRGAGTGRPDTPGDPQICDADEDPCFQLRARRRCERRVRPLVGFCA